MIKRDFHVHTCFCDGKNTPEELVKKAISLYFSEIGLVCHAFTPRDTSYCIKREDINAFIDEVNRLKQKYKDKIAVFCGVEYDYFADMDVSKFDFIIGSVHYVEKDGNYISVDESKNALIDSVNKFYDGNVYAFIDDYYQTLGDIYSKIKPNFIGHFDLVSKFNAKGDLFNESSDRYICAWKKCLDKLLSNGAVFELNVGAISRGYKDTPYPSKEQIEYILSKGGKFVINSDAHSVDGLCVDYEKYISLVGEENITKVF